MNKQVWLLGIALFVGGISFAIIAAMTPGRLLAGSDRGDCPVSLGAGVVCTGPEVADANLATGQISDDPSNLDATTCPQAVGEGVDCDGPASIMSTVMLPAVRTGARPCPIRVNDGWLCTGPNEPEMPATGLGNQGTTLQIVAFLPAVRN